MSRSVPQPLLAASLKLTHLTGPNLYPHHPPPHPTPWPLHLKLLAAPPPTVVTHNASPLHHRRFQCRRPHLRAQLISLVLISDGTLTLDCVRHINNVLPPYAESQIRCGTTCRPGSGVLWRRQADWLPFLRQN